jgi:hypothetical protein
MGKAHDDRQLVPLSAREIMQAHFTQPTMRWWPEIPGIPRRDVAPKQHPQKPIEESLEVGDDLRALFNDGGEDGAESRPRKTGDWLETVEKSAFWQAVDAIRAYTRRKPTQKKTDLFGNVVRDTDDVYAVFMTELAWIFGAENGAPLPFEAAADAVGINPARFRRICQRAFPEECALIDHYVGALQGV